MDIGRRHAIGFGAAAAGLLWARPGPSWAAAFQGPAIDLGPVVERVRAFARADLAGKGLPGMQVALVGPGGASAAFAVGLADVDAGIAATPAQLFQIGSISKSLTVMAVYGLADRGRLDLAARVQDLLPEVPLPEEPITVAQLIEHSSGLPNGVGESIFPRVPGGRFWTGFAPGSRFSYCNTGYNLLGHIAARAAGMPFDRALRTLVLQPLGMDSAKPLIRIADRAAYATGHARLREDVPWLPGARLTEARWLDFTNAAGSVAATAADMVRYLRFVVRLGQGKGAPLFSDAVAQRYRSPTLDTGTPGEGYGHGFRHRLLEDRAILSHTGGMIGFSSAVTVDPAAGVGVYASVNVGGAGGYRPTEINVYAIELLRAAAARSALPAPRDPAPPPAVPEALAARTTGRWVAADGGEFTVARRSGAMFLASGGIERRLAAAGDVLVTDHPVLAPYILAPHEGPTALLRLGGRLFGREAAPPVPAAAPRIAALAGAYFAPEAWTSHARVHAVGDRLFLGGNRLQEAPDRSWRFADPALTSERIWFENVADGRPQTMNMSGVHFIRQPVA